MLLALRSQVEVPQAAAQEPVVGGGSGGNITLRRYHGPFDRSSIPAKYRLQDNQPPLRPEQPKRRARLTNSRDTVQVSARCASFRMLRRIRSRKAPLVIVSRRTSLSLNLIIAPRPRLFLIENRSTRMRIARVIKIIATNKIPIV